MEATDIEVLVVPWPRYPDDGRGPIWEVQVTEPKRVHRGLLWSPRLGRFSKSWATMHLRRSAPVAHREAVSFMCEFCSKKKQPERDIYSGLNGTNQANSGTLNGTSSRAQETLRVMSRLSHGTQTRDKSIASRDTGAAGQDSPALRASRPVPRASWMHLAAMNLVHDHEAGIEVPAEKLNLARRLLGLDGSAKPGTVAA